MLTSLYTVPFADFLVHWSLCWLPCILQATTSGFLPPPTARHHSHYQRSLLCRIDRKQTVTSGGCVRSKYGSDVIMPEAHCAWSVSSMKLTFWNGTEHREMVLDIQAYRQKAQSPSHNLQTEDTVPITQPADRGHSAHHRACRQRTQCPSHSLQTEDTVPITQPADRGHSAHHTTCRQRTQCPSHSLQTERFQALGIE